MRNIIIILLSFIWLSSFLLGAECKLPASLIPLEKKGPSKLLQINGDIKHNTKALENMCVHLLSFRERKYPWRMILIYNPANENGPFWFLPHDDENTAFSAAVYSTKKYGGGFLAVLSDNNRYYLGQDPNRNFGESLQSASTCRKQMYPAPLYSRYVFQIIDIFRKQGMPYLAMHNNKNGWYGNGGTGGISILKKSNSVKSYSSGKVKVGHKEGIKDEDSMIYIAGIDSAPPSRKLNRLLRSGIHVKYEIVNQSNNDCSMSNYVVLEKGGNYYNIETERGDLAAQKVMIDKLMSVLGISPIESAKKKHGLGLF